MSEQEVLARVRQSGEVERFVAARNGEWDHAAWLEFRDHIVRTFGPVPDDQLGELLESEKRRYHSCSQPDRPLCIPSECPSCGGHLTTTHPSVDPPTGRTYCPRCENSRTVCRYCGGNLWGGVDCLRCGPPLFSREEPTTTLRIGRICPTCGGEKEAYSERIGDRGGPFDNVWIKTRYACPRCENA